MWKLEKQMRKGRGFKNRRRSERFGNERKSWKWSLIQYLYLSLYWRYWSALLFNLEVLVAYCREKTCQYWIRSLVKCCKDKIISSLDLVSCSIQFVESHFPKFKRWINKYVYMDYGSWQRASVLSCQFNIKYGCFKIKVKFTKGPNGYVDYKV